MILPCRTVPASAALAACVAFAPAMAQDSLDVPSGQAVTFLDTVWAEPGPEGLTARFRFVAPGIARDGGHVDFEAATADMAWLCEHYALPRIPATGPQPSQVIISLSDRAVKFGEASPQATQYFEAYRIAGATCIWEGF